MGKRSCCLCGLVAHEYGVSLHKFPKNEATCLLWKEACNFKRTDDVSHLYLCSRHFVDDDFNNPKAEEYGGLLRLKANIVPSVNVPNPGKRTLTSSTIPVQIDVIEPQPSTSKEVELQMPVECTEKDVHSGCEQLLRTPKKRKFENPRYVGDIGTPEVATPRRAKKALFVLKDTVVKQRTKIKVIQAQNRRLIKKLRLFQGLIEHLKSKNLMTEEAGNA